MNLGLKKVSWRVLGLALLGLSLIASVTFNFVLMHNTASARSNTLRSGVIAAGTNPVKVTRTGTVNWATLPKVAANATTVTHGKPVPTGLDRLTPAQRAAYIAAVKSGKIKTPFTPTLTAAATSPKANVPNPNFDACGYGDLPCTAYGFAGLNSTQGGGWYPPDQALALNTSQLMEGNNNVFALYNFHGAFLYGPTSSFTFFAPILQGSDILSDPQMFWDPTRTRWIIVEIEINQSSGTTDFYDVAVSKSQNGNTLPSLWYLYQINANVNVGGTANWCDYPTLGNDYWGVYLDCVAFSQSASAFLGNAVFALSKNALYSGITPVVHYWTQVPSGVSNGVGGFYPAYRLSSVNQDATADGEFLIATDAGQGAGATNNLTTAAFTNTHALAANSAGSVPTFSYVTSSMPVSYTDPINATQPGAGLANSVYPGFGTKQIEYKGGNLYFALTTAVNGGAHDGVYWAEVQPQLTGLNPSNPGAQVVQASLVRQNNIFAFSNADAYMPSFEASSEDDEVLSFNISSSTIYPSIAFSARRATDPLNSMGLGSQYAYAVTGTNVNTSGRWGDYSACALSPNLTSRGLIFCAGEYGGPHASNGGIGWDTYIYGLQM